MFSLDVNMTSDMEMSAPDMYTMLM